ncbi:Undecaprenyl-phosphate 4-deoxy-4-formamido-L-arabinose transferase [anaerobic digester metagenome]
MANQKEKNFVSAVVYVHNDSNGIVSFLKRINDVLFANFEKFEIICVNDASVDESKEKIAESGKTMENCVLSIVNMSYEQGVEASMNAGLQISIGDFVFQFDNLLADYDPDLIMEVYRHSLTGYDIVAASNQQYKSVSSKLFYRVFNRAANFQYALDTQTFLLISRRAINRVNSMSRTIPYRKAVYANCGLKCDCLTYQSNGQAVSRISNSQRMETAVNSLVLFTNIAYRISFGISVFMILATLGMVIYTFATYFYGRPVEGFTTTMLVMTGCFFGVFTILTFVLKYLSILVDLVFKRRVHIIESIEKITK